MFKRILFGALALLIGVQPCFAQFPGNGGKFNKGVYTVDYFSTGRFNSQSLLNRLKNVGGGGGGNGGLTFFKDFRGKTANLDADFSVGSGLDTFTRNNVARSCVNAGGVIDKITTANVWCNQGGYYDTTGFHSQGGLMIEAAGTNLLTRTDGTAYAAGLWTGWTQFTTGTIGGTVTKTNSAITDLTSISGATSQRIQYTGIAGDNGRVYVEGTRTASGTVVNGNVVTVSLWARSQTGHSGIALNWPIDFQDAAGANLNFENWNPGTLSTQWRRYSQSFTATDASTDRISVAFGSNASQIQVGESFDQEIYGVNFEIAPYATSWVPTTTAALTRGAEVLSYPLLSNRTEATETIFIRFAPESDFANDGIIRKLTTTDTKERAIQKTSTGDIIFSQPNATDTATAGASSTTIPAANTSYVSASVFKHSSPYVEVYVNGVSQATDTTPDFTDPVWGTYWYLGADTGGAKQLNGIVEAVAIFGRSLSSSEILYVSNLLNSN